MFDLLSESLFMIPLVICSVVALAVMVHRFIALRGERVVPETLAQALEGGDMGRAQDLLDHDDSSLALIYRKSLARPHPDRVAAVSSAEACAREEVTRLQAGLTTLEIIITIAPLLGLLGTVSGLVTVFSGLGDSSAAAAPSGTGIARGIAEALNTTIAGLVVAVPAVIAHGYFQRKIDRLTVRMERVLFRVVEHTYGMGGSSSS